MNTIVHPRAGFERDAFRSLAATSLTVLLAAYTHAYDFGPVAYLAGAVLLGAVLAAGLAYRRRGGVALRVTYGVLDLWIIVGFGIVGGFWNHAVKLVVSAIHGGMVPASLEPWFLSLAPGSATFEIAGVLMFVTSLPAAWYGRRFLFGPRRPASSTIEISTLPMPPHS